jgi:branched-subunit amino acid ABC-type transport system permease component
MLLTSAVISGLGLGSMYGLIALGFHVTYVVSNTVNFSQGSAMMLGAVLGYTFAVTLGWPLPLAAMTALAACALAGAVIERTLVRPFAERGSNAWLMATVAGGIVPTTWCSSLRQGTARLSLRARDRSRCRFSAPASIRYSSSSRWRGSR